MILFNRFSFLKINNLFLKNKFYVFLPYNFFINNFKKFQLLLLNSKNLGFLNYNLNFLMGFIIF